MIVRLDARTSDRGSVTLSAPCEPEELLALQVWGSQCTIRAVMPALPLQAGDCSPGW